MCLRPNASQFRVLKKLIVLTHPTPAATPPAHPESAETASSPRDAPYPMIPCKAAANYCLIRGGWDDPNCARPTRASLSTSLLGVAKTALNCAHRTIYMLPPSLLVISLGMGADRSSTARVQRGPSEAARCASTEDHQAPSLPLFCEQGGHLAAPFSFFGGLALREHGDRPSYPAHFFSTLLCL